MPAKPRSMGDAVAKARADIAAARLADSDEHFPYKLDAVRELVQKDAPLGPAGPKDSSVAVQDVMSARIAEASAAYVEAQARHLENPTPATKNAYEAAKDDLVAARRSHRRSRVDADGNPTGAILGMTRAELPDHYVGPRLRRVGEE